MIKILLLSLGLLAAGYLQAEHECCENGDQRSVTVDAIAVAKAPPDRLEWLLEIKSVKPSVKESRSAADASLQRLVAALKAAGVTETNLSISDVDQGRDYEWTDRKRIFKGYYSTVRLRLGITDFQLTSRINSEILADDLIEVLGIVRRSEQEGGLRRKALADAAEAARAKADVLAKALGATVGAALRIEETSFESSGYANPSLNSIHRTTGSEEDEISLQLTEISVRASIQVTFELVK